jgi:hypothetical protein
MYMFSYFFCMYCHRVTGARGGAVVEANRKVAGSNPDGVIGIFYLHKPSGRQEYFLGVKATGAQG